MIAESQKENSGSFPVQLFEPMTFVSEGKLAFRLYPDNRPANLEIAPLQKGLVLILSGEELIEEGAGFGAPIAKYEDCAYFSRTAKLFVDEQSDKHVKLRKEFFLDAVSRKRVKGASINEDFYSIFHKTFERAYLGRRSMRPVFDWTMRLRKNLGVTTQFPLVPSKGKVSVTYTCSRDKILIAVDLSELDTKGCDEVLLLNEQGASTFRRYVDCEGNEYQDTRIGGWSRVMAKIGSFSDARNKVSFSLETKEGASMYFGREQVKDRFSWSGITYALSPAKKFFEYSVRTNCL